MHSIGNPGTEFYINTAVGSTSYCQSRKTLEPRNKVFKFRRNDTFCSKEIQKMNLHQIVPKGINNFHNFTPNKPKHILK